MNKRSRWSQRLVLLGRLSVILVLGILLVIVCECFASHLEQKYPRFPVAIVAYLGVLLAFVVAFLAFSYGFRHGWLGIVLSGIMLLFGFVVYHAPGRIRPSTASSRPWIHAAASADNALGSFFLSRGGYDDFGEDVGSASWMPSFTNLLWGNVGAALKASSGTGEQAANPAIAANVAAVTNAVAASIVDWEAVRSNGKPGAVPAPASIGSVGWYYLFHALCYAYSAALLCAVFARRLMNLLFLFLVHWLSKCSVGPKYAVFWGDCDEALAVAASSGNRLPVFALLERKSFALRRSPTSAETRLDEAGHLWAYVAPDTLEAVCARYLRHGPSEHYFLSPDGQANVAAADVLLKGLKGCPSVKVFIRIDADAEEDVLFQWADTWAKIFGNDGPEINLVHEPSQVAAALLRQYPMLETAGISVAEGKPSSVSPDLVRSSVVSSPGVSSFDSAETDPRIPFRVLLVGFGAQGKAILRENVQLGVFPGTRRSICVTVVDGDAKAFEPLCSFLGRADGLIDNDDPSDPVFPAGILFRALDIRSSEFWNYVRARIPERNGRPQSEMPWNRVVFALPDDLENLRLAKRMERLYRNHHWLDEPLADGANPVFFAGVRRPANDRYARTVVGENEEGTDRDPWMATFGNLNHLYTGLLDNLAASDRGAVYLNWAYRKSDRNPLPEYDLPEALRLWRKATFFDKESTRASVAGAMTLARLLGFRVSDRNDSAPAPVLRGGGESLFSGKDDILDNLTKFEHLRWCAFHLLRRIRPWFPSSVDVAKIIVEDRGDEIRGAPVPDPEKDEHPSAWTRPNDLERHGRHAGLVPLGKLVEVDRIFREGTEMARRSFSEEDCAKIESPSALEGVDRSFVRQLDVLLEHSGLACVSCEPNRSRRQ